MYSTQNVAAICFPCANWFIHRLFMKMDQKTCQKSN